MKKLFVFLAVLALAYAQPSFATGQKPTPKPEPVPSSTSSANANAGAIGVGVGVGVGGAGGAGGQGGQGGKGGSAVSVSKGGNAKATGGSAKQGQAQQQGQVSNQTLSSAQRSLQNTRQRNSQNVGGQSMGGQSSSNTISIEGDSYEAAAYAPDVFGNSTAPCVKGTGLSIGTIGLTGGISMPTESQNCWAFLKAEQIANFAGGDAGLMYLAMQDPAACVVAEARGLVRCAPRSGGWQAQLNQTQPGAGHVASDARVCRLKAGTANVVVTNWEDRMACARSLGL